MCSGCVRGVFGVCLGCVRGVFGVCLGCVWVYGVEEFSVGFQGLVVGFNFGFGRTKTTRNVIWGSILTPCRKNAQNNIKMKFGEKRGEK